MLRQRVSSLYTCGKLKSCYNADTSTFTRATLQSSNDDDKGIDRREVLSDLIKSFEEVLKKLVEPHFLAMNDEKGRSEIG